MVAVYLCSFHWLWTLWWEHWEHPRRASKLNVHRAYFLV